MVRADVPTSAEGMYFFDLLRDASRKRQAAIRIRPYVGCPMLGYAQTHF